MPVPVILSKRLTKGRTNRTLGASSKKSTIGLLETFYFANRGETKTVKVQRSGSLANTATVNWAVSPREDLGLAASDFANNTLPSGTLLFAKGQSVAVITFTFSTGNAPPVELRGRFTLSNPSVGELGDRTFTFAINPRVSIFDSHGPNTYFSDDQEPAWATVPLYEDAPNKVTLSTANDLDILTNAEAGATYVVDSNITSQKDITISSAGTRTSPIRIRGNTDTPGNYPVLSNVTLRLRGRWVQITHLELRNVKIIFEGGTFTQIQRNKFYDYADGGFTRGAITFSGRAYSTYALISANDFGPKANMEFNACGIRFARNRNDVHHWRYVWIRSNLFEGFSRTRVNNNTCILLGEYATDATRPAHIVIERNLFRDNKVTCPIVSQTAHVRIARNTFQRGDVSFPAPRVLIRYGSTKGQTPDIGTYIASNLFVVPTDATFDAGSILVRDGNHRIINNWALKLASNEVPLLTSTPAGGQILLSRGNLNYTSWPAVKPKYTNNRFYPNAAVCEVGGNHMKVVVGSTGDVYWKPVNQEPFYPCVNCIVAPNSLSRTDRNIDVQFGPNHSAGLINTTAAVTDGSFSTPPPRVSYSNIGLRLAEGEQNPGYRPPVLDITGGKTVTEANTSVVLSVRRSGDLSRASSVTWTKTGTTDSADFAGGQLFTGTLNWGINDDVPKTIVLNIVSDGLSEGTETAIVTLSSPVNATLGAASTIVTILDSAATPVVNILGSQTVTEAVGAFSLIVSRTGNTTGASSVAWSTSGTATTGDFIPDQPMSGTINWDANDTADKTLSFSVFNDVLVEAAETLIVTLSSPSGCTLGTSVATVTITDDDAAPIYVPPIIAIGDGDEVTEADGDVVLTVTRTGDWSKGSSVHWTLTGASSSDFKSGQAFSGDLNWGIDDGVAKTITLQVKNNLTEGPGVVAVVTLSAPVNATLGQSTASVRITDDDTATGVLPAGFPAVPTFTGSVVNVKNRTELLNAIANSVAGDNRIRCAGGVDYGTIVINRSTTHRFEIICTAPRFTSLNTTQRNDLALGSRTDRTARNAVVVGDADPTIENYEDSTKTSTAYFQPIKAGVFWIEGFDFRAGDRISYEGAISGDVWMRKNRFGVTEARHTSFGGTSSACGRIIDWENWHYSDGSKPGEGQQAQASYTDYGIKLYNSQGLYVYKSLFEGGISHCFSEKLNVKRTIIHSTIFTLWSSRRPSQMFVLQVGQQGSANGLDRTCGMTDIIGCTFSVVAPNVDETMVACLQDGNGMLLDSNLVYANIKYFWGARYNRNPGLDDNDIGLGAGAGGVQTTNNTLLGRPLLILNERLYPGTWAGGTLYFANNTRAGSTDIDLGTVNSKWTVIFGVNPGYKGNASPATPLTPAAGSNITSLLNGLATGSYTLPAGTFFAVNATLKSGVSITGAGKGVTIIKLPNSTYNSNSNQTGISVLKYVSKSNCSLKDLTVDGNRFNQIIQNNGGADGGSPGFFTGTRNGDWMSLSMDNCTGFSVINCSFINAGTDGLYLDGGQNNSFTDCEFTRNRRQGCSPTKIDGLTTFTRCKFNSNGNRPGIEAVTLGNQSGGCEPMAGVDIEANNNTDNVTDLRFIDCETIGNGFSGFMSDNRTPSTPTYTRMRIINHTSTGNGASSESLKIKVRTGRSVDTLVQGGTFDNNIELGGASSSYGQHTNLIVEGITLTGANKQIKIVQLRTGSSVIVRNNDLPSGNASVTQSDIQDGSTITVTGNT